MPKKSSKEFFTMKDRLGSIFLKFYDEQIIEFWGSQDEKDQVHAYAADILAINEKMKSVREDKTLSDVDKELALQPLDDARKQKNEDLEKFCNDTVHRVNIPLGCSYFQAFCNHISAIPCVPNEGTYAWTDCYYIMLIKHDRDYHKNDIWNPELEKPHYHIAARTMPCPGQRIRQIQLSNWLENIICIRFRQGIDDNLMKRAGVDVCRNYNDCCQYLLHNTEASINDGKSPYHKDELVTNMTSEFRDQLLLGMHRIDAGLSKLSIADWERLERSLYDYGLTGGKFKDWFKTQSFSIRSSMISGREKAKVCYQAYYDGIMEYTSKHKLNFVRHAIYIEGSYAAGKSVTSRLALNALGRSDDDIFEVGKGTAKFDAYDEQSVMICDDRGLSDIRKVCESSVTRLYKRGRGEALWRGDIVIITSNIDFREFCIQYTLGCKDVAFNSLSESDKESVLATESRFSYFRCDSSNDNMIYLKKLSNRELGRKRIEQAKFCFDFLNAYNSARRAFLDKQLVVVDDKYIESLDFAGVDGPNAFDTYDFDVFSKEADESYLRSFFPEDYIDEFLPPDVDGRLRIGWEPTPADNPFTRN